MRRWRRVSTRGWFAAAILAVAGALAGPGAAQTAEVSADAVGDGLLDASATASQLSASASSGSGDARAQEAFREMAGEGAILLSAIGNALRSGDVEGARALHRQLRELAIRGRRLAEQADIEIDSASADELADALEDLDRLLYPEDGALTASTDG
jgi:hypothetical protein